MNLIIIGLFLFSLMIGLFSLYMGGLNVYFYVNTLIIIGFDIYLYVRLKKYGALITKKRLMYSFIEYFILNFDIQNTVEATVIIVLTLFDEKAKTLIEKNKRDEGLNLLENLRSFFSHQYYESFLESVNLVVERGGELIKTCEILLYTISNSEAQIQKITRIDNTYFFKFIFHWFFIFIVGVIFRFSLDYTISKAPPAASYLLGIESFILVFVISLGLVVENRLRRIHHVS